MMRCWVCTSGRESIGSASTRPKSFEMCPSPGPTGWISGSGINKVSNFNSETLGAAVQCCLVSQTIDELINQARSGDSEPFHQLVLALRADGGVPVAVLVEYARSSEDF